MKGIGSDLIDIRRIDKTIARFGDRFKKRIFTDNEIKKCEKRKQSVPCYAKRFAAKEAAAKGTRHWFPQRCLLARYRDCK